MFCKKFFNILIFKFILIILVVNLVNGGDEQDVDTPKKKPGCFSMFSRGNNKRNTAKANPKGNNRDKINQQDDQLTTFEKIKIRNPLAMI
jgi:hypothetical protein